MNAGGLIVRGAAASAVGFPVRLAARLLFLVVAGQLYGAALFGAYSLAVAAVELAVALSGLGMKRLLFQRLDNRGTRRETHILADAAVLVAMSGALLAALLALAMVLIPQGWVSPNTARALLLLSPMIVLQALLDLLLAATRWRHLIRYEVLGRSAVEPWAALAGAAGAWYGGFEATGLLIGYWCGTLAAFAFAALGVGRAYEVTGLSGWRPRRPDLAAMLGGAAANSLADGLSGLLVRLDLYLVGFLLGESAAGIYGMARQLALPIRQVRQSFDGLLTPVVARTLESDGPAAATLGIASASRLVLAVQVPMIVAMVAVGQPLLDWLGPGFAAGWAAAVLIACAEATQGAFGITELILAYRRPQLGLGIMAATAATAIPLVLAGIMLQGLTGAAAAVLFTYVARTFARRWALKRSLGVDVHLRLSLAPALAGAAGAAVAALIAAGGSPWSWVLAAAAGLAVYAALIVAWMRASGQRLGIEHLRT